MNNFIFENTTKTYFGKGCVKEYLALLIENHHTIMVAYGGGSIKQNGIYDEVMEIYFSEPNEENVSDDIYEALMRSVIRDLRAALENPKDDTARSNLMWESTMAENRIIKLGKRCDFQCHNMEHQLGAYTDCNHGFGLAVLHPVYYRHIYKEGIEALAGFIQEIGLPTTLRELGVKEQGRLKEMADSCWRRHHQV